MEKELKELVITFENCEDIVIPRNAIGEFSIDGIHTIVKRIASNSISEYTVADEIIMEIFKEGNQKYRPFGGLEENETLTRLSEYKDITSITVKFTDQTEEIFWVCYDEGDKEGVLGAENINEDIYTSELGNIYIVISNKVKKVIDCFDLEHINNKDAIDFEKDMYGIGVEESEIVSLSDNELPDLYRYVYLFFQNDDQTLAVRVEDLDSGWKWICQDEDLKGKIPVFWKYPNKKINSFIMETEKNGKMDIEEIKRKHTVHDDYYWHTERWSDGDLEAALENAEFPVTDENICKLRDSCHDIFKDKSERNEAIAMIVSEVFGENENV